MQQESRRSAQSSRKDVQKMAETVFSVIELNRYIKSLLDKDNRLFSVFVRGEISNWKLHYSGHAYFSLKDEKSTVRAVMFKSSASRLKFLPENGQKVIAAGRVSVYERDGQYQLYVDDLLAEGIGDLHYQYEQLIKKLEQEGLFDKARKKPLPKYPRKIGVVTSSTGAAVRDILNILSRRWKHANVYLYPVLVQGKDAPPQIIEALRYLDKKTDVIITGRGGGSMEDLWAFNDENVARTIAAMHTPVISAVGHETDFTISDFAADLRAPTPSAAAELAVPDEFELRQSILQMQARLHNAVSSIVSKKRIQVQAFLERPVLQKPNEIIDRNQLYLDSILKDLTNAAQIALSQKKESLASLSAKLDSLSPLSVLGRGYAIAETQTGTVIKSVKQINKGEHLTLTLTDGKASCQVEEIMQPK